MWHSDCLVCAACGTPMDGGVLPKSKEPPLLSRQASPSTAILRCFTARCTHSPRWPRQVDDRSLVQTDADLKRRQAAAHRLPPQGLRRPLRRVRPWPLCVSLEGGERTAEQADGPSTSITEVTWTTGLRIGLGCRSSVSRSFFTHGNCRAD